jgi:hypothetical protein
MAVAADLVAEGAFFKTHDNQIRAVLAVKDGAVKYVAGASDFRNRNFGSPRWRKMEDFLAEVDEPVEETWDPDYVHPEASQGGAPTDSES